MQATTNQSPFWSLKTMVRDVTNVQPLAMGEGKDGVKFQKLMERQQNNPPEKLEQPTREKTVCKETEEVSAEEPVQVQEDPREMARRLVEMGMVAVDAPSVQAPEAPVTEEISAPALTVTLEAAPEEEPTQPILMEEAPELPVQTDVPLHTETGTQAQAQTEQPELMPEEAAELPQPETVQAQPETEFRQAVHTSAREHVQTQPEQDQQEEVTVTEQPAQPEPVFHDVKAVPIKVGEAARPRETEEAPDVDRQLKNRLTEALDLGETKIKLDLAPERLGSVKVELTRTVEGAIRVTLGAQSGETRSLLEKHIDGLKELLGARTQSSVEVEVHKGEESQRHSDNPYEGHNGQGRQQQQEQRRRSQPSRGEDFLQQLRLGLIPVEEV